LYQFDFKFLINQINVVSWHRRKRQ